MPPISRDGIVDPLSALILINAEGLISGRDLQQGGARAPRQIWAGARVEEWRASTGLLIGWKTSEACHVRNGEGSDPIERMVPVGCAGLLDGN